MRFKGKERNEVFVDDVTLEFAVPTIVQVLLLDEVANVYVAELGDLSQRRRRCRFPSSGCTRYEQVGFLPAPTATAVTLRHFRNCVRICVCKLFACYVAVFFFFTLFHLKTLKKTTPFNSGL